MGWINSGSGQKEFAPRIKKQFPINSPLSQVIYSLNTRSKVEERIALLAVADADIRDLYWFVNEQFVGKSSVDKPLFWSPQTGRFIVRVVDDQGQSDSLEVRVTAVR